MLAAAVVVFVSYSHTDRPAAKLAIAELKEAHCAVLVDEQIKKGSQWMLAVQAFIESSDVVLVLWSKNANTSRWVLPEIMWALYRGKRIVPLKLDDSESISLIGIERTTMGHLGADIGCVKE